MRILLDHSLARVNASHNSPEVDFVVWVGEVACFALNVKGGAYWIENGTLFRQGPNGPEQVTNPLPRAMDGALSIRNAIAPQLDSRCFVIPVLLFTDTEEDPELQRWAQDAPTNVMFGVDDLIQRLTQLQDVQTVRQRPSAHRIDQEAAALTPGMRPENNQANPPGALPIALHAKHVEIHNLVVNLYVAPGPIPFVRQDLEAPATVAGEGDMS